MRVDATLAEKRLWFGLRNLKSFKFRRQHRIERFVLDFYCPTVKLSVEVDGSVHLNEEARLRDEEREAELRELGIRTIRFPNEHVIGDLGKVVRTIEEVCTFL